MKANEAPEKIYLVRTTRIIDEWRRKPSQYAHNIEYTRTDAFIDRACEWLEKNIAELTGVDSYAITESFKQAMKENDMTQEDKELLLNYSEK